MFACGNKLKGISWWQQKKNKYFRVVRGGYGGGGFRYDKLLLKTFTRVEWRRRDFFQPHVYKQVQRNFIKSLENFTPTHSHPRVNRISVSFTKHFLWMNAENYQLTRKREVCKNVEHNAWVRFLRVCELLKHNQSKIVFHSIAKFYCRFCHHQLTASKKYFATHKTRA